MEVLYLSILFVIIVIYVITFGYRKNDRIPDGRYKYKFKFMCGMSMYIVDKLRKKKRYCGKRKNLNKMKQLYVRDIVEDEEYMYTIDKVSLSIIVFTVILSAGTFYTYTYTEDKSYTEELERPEYGQISKEFSLEAENGLEKETVHIVVKEREYRQEEIEKVLDESYQDVVDKMLNGNLSLSQIEKNLRFDSNYGDKGINLFWGCENPEVIDYDGKVYRKDTDQEVIIYLTMSFAGVDKNHEIPVTILASTDKSIAEKVQEKIDAYDIYDDKVTLPKELDGKKIYFSQVQDKLNLPFLMIAAAVSLCIYFLKDNDIDKELNKRKAQLESDYSEIVSKLMLLNSAGMNIRIAWKKIVKDYERQKCKNGMRFAYEEMKLADNKMNSGVSETDAYREFGKRCGLHNYIKLGSILEQNLVKGTKGMRELLQYEVHEAFEERKNIAKKHGDEAGTKMLFPMVIMLIVSIVIVILPSFLTMSKM
ncbi:MAG: hypothetical protein HDT39_08615 [Lachnospiraceae bacterium]|nr:hypothetical protein [Lachnospiraceae bacterium]